MCTFIIYTYVHKCLIHTYYACVQTRDLEGLQLLCSTLFVQMRLHRSIMETDPGLLSQYSDGLRSGRPGFYPRQRQGSLYYSAASRPSLAPTQPPVQWVLGGCFPGIKRKGHEADHSPLSSAGVKNGGILLPLQVFMAWCSFN
jgi:hypothetical protein